MYRVISATPSPYARKVRIALAEKGIPFELATEVPWDSTTETPAYNPLEKLPVLVLPDGRGLYKSRFILEWLEAKHPEPPLLPADTDGILILLCHSLPWRRAILQAARASRQPLDERDREAAADGGDGVRHVPLRPDRGAARPEASG